MINVTIQASEDAVTTLGNAFPALKDLVRWELGNAFPALKDLVRRHGINTTLGETDAGKNVSISTMTMEPEDSQSHITTFPFISVAMASFYNRVTDTISIPTSFVRAIRFPTKRGRYLVSLSVSRQRFRIFKAV